VGGEGSWDELRLSAGEGSLSASLWGAHSAYDGGMAKSYFWGPLGEGTLSASVSMLFCTATRSA